MSSAVLRPGPLYGSVEAPPSKSYTHRALVVGHLAGRAFRVVRPLDSDDTRATASALEVLGTRVARGKADWRLTPGASRTRRSRIRCGESGTTLRFVCALAGLLDRAVEITGSGRLPNRPIDELLRAMRGLGAEARHIGPLGLPVVVRGPMHGGQVALDASESSQFASALLLALPVLPDDSEIELRGTVVSRPYLEATRAVLAHHGVRVERRGRRWRIPGHQRIHGSVFRVPGDASSAAYLWAAAAVTGGRVRVRGIPRRWPQADLAVLDLLRLAGAEVDRGPDGATVSGRSGTPFRVDLTDAPDLYPLAGVIAATIPGISRISGAEHVVLKESDRKTATARLIRSFGARVDVGRAGLRIEGTARPRPIRTSRLTDHRLVMSAAVGALAAAGDSQVGSRDSVGKSFPGFWNSLATLSGGDAVR